MEAAARWKMRNLVFAVNGQRFDLPTVDPSMSLLEFLRTETVYKGAKLGCGEGLFIPHTYPLYLATRVSSD